MQTEIDNFIQTMLGLVEYQANEIPQESGMAGDTAKVVLSFGMEMRKYLSSENANTQQFLNDLASNCHDFVADIKKADVYPFAIGLPDFSNA